MGTLREAAKDFVPKQTKNIADLPTCSVDVEIMHDGMGTDNEGKDFVYSYIVLNEEEYRVPNSVLGQLKDLIEASPDFKNFKVKKSGEGLKTRYTTIPLV